MAAISDHRMGGQLAGGPGLKVFIFKLLGNWAKRVVMGNRIAVGCVFVTYVQDQWVILEEGS